MMLTEQLRDVIWAKASHDVREEMSDRIWVNITRNLRNPIANATFGTIIAAPVANLFGDFIGITTWIGIGGDVGDQEEAPPLPAHSTRGAE